MKITLGSILLNGGGETPQDFCVDMRRRIQTEYAIGSPNARIFDRQNKSVAVSFVIERSHATQSLAEDFAASHAEEISNLSTPAFKFSVNKDSFILSNAAVSRVRTECDGIMTRTSYEFSGESINRI